jgi:hypothetical protein
MKETNPFSNMVMVNGLIVDKKFLSPEIQEIIDDGLVKSQHHPSTGSG